MSKFPLIPLKALPKANNVTIVSENENSNDSSFIRPNSQMEVRKPSSTKNPHNGSENTARRRTPRKVPIRMPSMAETLGNDRKNTPEC
jgi:hypothetical protein